MDPEHGASCPHVATRHTLLAVHREQLLNARGFKTSYDGHNLPVGKEEGEGRGRRLLL